MENTPYNEDWEQDAPLLASLKGTKPPGDVPEGYFDALPSSIMAKIAEEKPIETAQPSQTRWFAIAATVALLISMGVFFGLRSGNTQDAGGYSADFSQVSTETLLAALEFEDISDAEIADAMGAQAFANLSTNSSLQSDELMYYLEGDDLNDMDFEGFDFDDSDLLETLNL